jgi:hypothetical protein
MDGHLPRSQLEAMVAQLRAAGISVQVDEQHYPNGRFAHLHNPEGNSIELWEPAGRDAPLDTRHEMPWMRRSEGSKLLQASGPRWHAIPQPDELDQLRPV